MMSAIGSLLRRGRVATGGIVWAILCFVPAVALAQITLDGDFDSGGLDETNSQVAGNLVLLAGRDNFNPGDWKWLHFQASNVNGLTPQFVIDDNFASGGSRLDNHEMVYSYDQQNWFFFDNNQHNGGLDNYTFSNNAPFTQDDVWVAYGLPYPMQKVTDHVNQVRSSPWVMPTASSNTDLILGQSSGGTDDIGRVIAPQNLYGYKITDPGAAGPKTQIGLVGGVHANEVLANHTLEGLVDFLVSDDERAAALREVAEFYVYPMANPDGRFAGYNRSTVQHENRDPNRFWDEPLYADMDDIMTVAEALKADTGSDLRYYIDFHSTTAHDNHFGFLDFDQGMHLDLFWQNFIAWEPTFGSNDASLINDTSIKFANNQLNSEFVVTFETAFIAGENIDRLHTLGENVGIAFQQALAPLPPSGNVEDFRFNDANGTPLHQAANDANPGNFWTADVDLTDTSVQNGGLLIQKSNDSFAGHYLQIDNITDGQAWLVMETDGWNFVDFNAAEPEELRLGFLDNDTGSNGSTITAQVEIERNATTGEIEINGQALGAGTNITPATIATTQDDPFTIVLQLDKSADTYEIFTKDGAGAFVSLGAGTVDPTRDGNSIRLVVNNHFGGIGEFFDTDRIYLTLNNPLLPVVLLGDANNDGQVTGADLIAVQQNFGNVGAADGLLLGDANDDGQVTGADLISVQQNFGNTLGAVAIPEPSMLTLLGLGGLLLIGRRSD